MPIKTATRLIEQAVALRRQNVPFDLVLQMMENFKATMGFSKICFYPIDYNMVRLTTENLTRDRKPNLHTIDFVDQSAGAVHRLAAICNDENDLISTIMFDGLKKPTPADRLLVRERGRKVGLLVYQSKLDGGPSFILQAEIAGPPEGADATPGAAVTPMTNTHAS